MGRSDLFGGTDLGVDLLYEVGVDVMGYNISPFLFFIEIYNNDEGNRKEYFGSSLRGTRWPYLVGCGEPGMETWTALREMIKRSFLDMSVLPLDGDQEEEETMT